MTVFCSTFNFARYETTSEMPWVFCNNMLKLKWVDVMCQGER